MAALITQSLDENLRILLITSASSFAKLLIAGIKQSSPLEIEAVFFSEFDLKKVQSQNWYKVVLVFDHPLEINDFLLKELCFSPEKTVVILPLTTAVKNIDEATDGWGKQVFQEDLLFKEINKRIDISRFIFYKDLVIKNYYPVKFILNQLNQSLLIDPSLELNLQTTAELSIVLIKLILQPQRKAKLVQGKPRVSTSYLQKVKDFYTRLYQVNLPIKRFVVTEVSHPILKGVSKRAEIEDSLESVVAIAKELLTFMGGKKHQVRIISKKLQPPLKKQLVKTWNKVDVNPKKLRLDLEYDLTEKVENLEGAEVETVEPKVINAVFKDARKEQKQLHLKKLTKKTKLGFKKIRNQKFLFSGGVIMSFLALGLLISTGLFLINISQVQDDLSAYFESRSMPITAQEKKITALTATVRQLEEKLAIANKWFSTPFFSNAFQLIEISRYVVDLNNQTLQMELAVSSYYQQLMGQEKTGSLEEVNKTGAEVFKTLSLLSAELKNYPAEKLSPEQNQLVAEYQDVIQDQEKKINQFQQLSPLLPQLLALNESKTYAVVLQNNQELRPTGGFIQAVALLTLKQGKLVSYTVEDVYSIDQQLAATITPPDEIKDYLGEERWFLRDSNWNPSFPQTASQIKWFLAKSIGVKVDGVIGINLKVLEEIIGVLDQVELAEYNEVLTERNFAERMEFHSEVQLIETAQNRDYSELVLDKVMQSLQVLSSQQVTPLLSKITQLADSQELFITVFENDLQATFEALGWNGSIINPACPGVFDTESCLVDYLMQVEANVGVNKANYYLERQIDHSIFISEAEVNHKRVMTFKNKAQTNAWPKGSYKAYVRFYLPTTADLRNLRINNQIVPTENLKTKKELNRLMVGVLIEVPVKSETIVQLEYALPHQNKTPFTYAFFDQKQSGARENSPRVFIQHQPDLSPTLIAPQAEVQGDVIVFNPSKDTGHMFVGVSFE